MITYSQPKRDISKSYQEIAERILKKRVELFGLNLSSIIGTLNPGGSFD